MKKLLPIFIALLVVICGLCIFTACGDGQITVNINGSGGTHFDGNCQTKGYTRYYLPNGSYYDVEDKEFGDHVYDDGVVTSTPTCTEDGESEYTCTLCAHKDTQITLALGHNYAETGSTATCMSAGVATYTCSRCDDSYDEDVDAMDHIALASYGNDDENHWQLCKYGCGTKVTSGAHTYDDGKTLIEANCIKKGLVKYTCTACEHFYTNTVDETDHDYTTSSLDATCMHAGVVSYLCEVCGDSYQEQSAMLPHVADTDISHNNEEHWHYCKYGCGTKLDKVSHSYNNTVVPSTCIEHSYTIFDCNDCDYSYQEVDKNSEFGSHAYEAYTCVSCQRDMLLDYVNTFNTGGADYRAPIDIQTETQLSLLLDYITLNRIGFDNKKYFSLSYITLSSNNEADNFVMKYLNKVIDLHTAANWGIGASYPTSDNISYIAAYVLSKYDDAKLATVTPDSDGYPLELCDQWYSYQFEEYPNTRSASFDDFAYKTRRYEMSVTTSDQLFYAFEHGYKPLPTKGSIAESLLSKAKAVSRKIIDDYMSDVDKVRAIYLWLVQEIQYDHGIVTASTVNEETKVWQYCSSYYLEGVFLYNIAVCDGISKAFCVLAGLEDIKCIRVTSSNHAWNKVLIDLDGDGQKEWYATDATWGNKKQTLNTGTTKYTNEQLSIDDFLFTDEQKVAGGQVAQNYQNVGCDAVTSVNPYAYMYYSEDADESCDYVIESLDEMKALFTYIAACVVATDDSIKSFITVDVFIATSYCETTEAINTSISIAYNAHKTGYTILRTTSKDTSTYDGVEGYVVCLYITIT